MRLATLFLVSVLAGRAEAQCPGSPGCGADPDLPRHFTIRARPADQGSGPDQLVIQPGETAQAEVWVEKYEAAERIIIWIEMDPAVAEFVGIFAGPDLAVIGTPGGGWNIETAVWAFNHEGPVHEGWQLNRIELNNWYVENPCAERIYGSRGAYRDLGIQARFHIFNIVVKGNAPGETPIYVDRRCRGGYRSSFMSYYVENHCPDASGATGANHCLRDLGFDGVHYVTLSPDFLPPPTAEKVRQAANGDWFSGYAKPLVVQRDAFVVVGTPTGVASRTWTQVKGLYR